MSFLFHCTYCKICFSFVFEEFGLAFAFIFTSNPSDKLHYIDVIVTADTLILIGASGCRVANLTLVINNQ